MIDVAHAGFVSALHLAPGRVRVTARHEALMPASGSIELGGAGKLGGTRRDLHDPALEVTVVLGGCGIAPTLHRMAAHLILREVWTVKMHARDPGAVGGSPIPLDVAARIDHSPDLLRRPRGGGRENGGGAATQMRAIGGLHRLRRPIHVIGAL